MIDAQELDRRITILRAPIVDDGLSKVEGTHVPIGKRWAKKTDVKDGERIAAAAQQQQLTTHFLVRFGSLTSTITGADRIQHGDVVYQVTGTKEARGRRVGIEITAAAIGL